MDSPRYVQLTAAGLKRLHAIRLKLGLTVEDIVADRETPSVNTVKKALRQGMVFISTLERIWDYLQRCAAERREMLSPLREGEDYVFVEGATKTEDNVQDASPLPDRPESRQGWISRQTPRPNRLFTGRREILDRLHAAFQPSQTTPVIDPQALSGLGGIGKTQTAIAYVYEHWKDYSHIFWVSAETVASLNDGLAGLAVELELLEGTPSTKNAALEKMHRWLRDQSDWLLVLDNADDLEMLAPHFPHHHSGRLLLTTRARNTVKWAAPIALNKFWPEEGALLLLRRAGILALRQTLEEASAGVVQAAMELSRELDGLPLALDQAGAYLSGAAISVERYHALYRACGLRLLDSATDPEHASVTITFTLALEQMAKRSVFGRAAEEMVRLSAFLAPDAIPEAIFRAYPFDLSHIASPEPDSYPEICAVVCAYSLAAQNPENRTVTVHHLLQSVTRNTMSLQENCLWIERAVQAVSESTPDFEFEDWSLCDLLLPQWRLCAEYIQDHQIETAQAAYLLYQAGRYLRARALYDEAESLLRMAVEVAERVHGANGRLVADYLDDLACLYRVLDRREDAERLHLRAVMIVEETEGPEHADTGSKLHNMALLYLQSEEYAKAEQVFERALAIYEKQPEPDPILIATTLTQLAGIYRMEGRFDKAEPCCRHALETYESLLEPDHIDIATGCNNLALLYLTMGRYEDAEALYLRALKINELMRGKEHPETGTVTLGLAKIRWKQRRIAEADALFRRSIEIYTRSFGKTHSRTTRMLSVYSEFQQEAMPSKPSE